MTSADLDMRKLRYFVAVAEELNFGRAAKSLHIAQPVLSRQIRALEDELGARLLTRDSRGTALTTAGRQLLEDARFMLAESKALRTRLRAADAAVVTMTVGVMPGLMATAAVRRFEAANPDIRTEIVHVGWLDQVRAVRDGELDVVYAREPIDHYGLGAAPLLDESRDAVLPVADPLSERRSLTMRDLADRRLIQHPDLVPEWYAVADATQRRAASRTIVTTVEEKLEKVAAGEGFAVLPHSTTKFYRRPDVRVIPIVDIGPSRVTLIWDASIDDPARDEFVVTALACRDQTV